MVKQIEKPGTASWDLSISDADFAKLKRGVKAESMDDHWRFLVMTDEDLANEALELANAALELASQPLANGDTPHVSEQVTDEEWQAELQRMEEETDEESTEEPPVDLVHGGNISIRRSWTNTELYRIVLKPSEGGASAKIEALVWEEDRIGGMTEEHAKIDVVFLCRSHAECDVEAAPDYDYQLFRG